MEDDLSLACLNFELAQSDPKFQTPFYISEQYHVQSLTHNHFSGNKGYCGQVQTAHRHVDEASLEKMKDV